MYCNSRGKQVYFPNPDPNKGSGYPTIKEAETQIRKLEKNDRNFLLRDLNATEREEYWRLRTMCLERNTSLEDAVMKGLSIGISRWPTKLSEAWPLFLAHCHKKKLKKTTIHFYENKYSVLFSNKPTTTFGDWDESSIKKLVKGRDNGAEWEKGCLRLISAFWNWGYRQDPKLAPYGITRGIDLENPKMDRNIDFLTLDESKRFMEAARKRWSRSALALMFYALMRKSEVQNMKWEWINFEDKTILIPSRVAKGGAPRLLERLPECLWDWLKPDGRPYVCRCNNIRYQINACREEAGLDEWPHSAIRHTAITHHMAAFRDSEWTRSLSGHDEAARTLETRYKGVVAHRKDGDYIPTQASGLAYFELR